MGKLREQMKMDLKLKGYSPKTQAAYLGYMKNFVQYFGRSPAKMGEKEIREYLYHLVTEKDLGDSSINSAYSALKFFYKTTLGRDWNVAKIPRRKPEKRLPVVLDGSEIKQLLAVTANLKHRALLMTTYSAGLRVSETAHLKVSDVDSKRMQLRVAQGKGKKDRYALLSSVTLNLLRDYWRQYRPFSWLFPGGSPDRPISTRSIQKIFEKAKRKAGIKKPATVHTLRHSFATHLLEAGTDIYRVQKLMGHTSPKTTAIYIHLRRQDLLKVVSPLDSLLGS
jgi:site-specific recombinase XerD